MRRTSMLAQPGRRGRLGRAAVAATLVAGGLTALVVGGAGGSSGVTPTDAPVTTTTPIKHVVVLFDENNSFDHYFATYPYAANTDGTPFRAAANTPRDIDTELNAGLLPGNEASAHNANGSQPQSSAQYQTPNPNTYQPQRLTPSQAVTCDQNHSYTAEQKAASMDTNRAMMSQFVESTNATCTTTGTYSSPGLVMDYYDGNTVTALWNYAQNYAMSDNSWDAVYGPSTPGALNLISGNTYSGTTTVNGDVDPNGDSCGANAGVSTPQMAGANVGDLLTAKGVSWGWFQGGFANCSGTTQTVSGAASIDYSPHHNPFEYYASTANPAHTPPASDAEVGSAGPANHEYDLTEFNKSLTATDMTMPAVSFLKAPEAQDGHAGYSDPLDEQAFLTSEINQIQQSTYWPSTAIVIAYDDSDGWYDHVAPVITNSSNDASSDAAICKDAATAGVPALAGESLRCGPSQRLPMLVISPYAKKNYVSHTLVTQASVLKFIEQNWSTGGIDAASSVKGSFDTGANSLDDFFDFSHPQSNEVLLDPTMYSAGTTLNPSFGAVASTPADSTPPEPAPLVSVAHRTLVLPEGSALPDQTDFLSQVGATIDHGTLAADLSGVDTDRAGTYYVTVGGSDGDVPVTSPATIEIDVPATISLAKSVLVFDKDSDPTASFVRGAAGATITSGLLDNLDLSGVNFAQEGTYQVQVTGTSGGLAALPATLTIVVEADPSTTPVIGLAHGTVVFPVGANPGVTGVTAAAEPGISTGTLDPISLAGVDFGKAGTYHVSVTGSADGHQAVPVTLTIMVVPTPVITLGHTTVTTPVGTALTGGQMSVDALASISEGTLDPVSLTAVDFYRPGTYPVTFTGSYLGIAAAPVTAMVHVTAAPTATRLTASRSSQAYGSSSVTTLTATVTGTGTPTGTVTFRAGSTTLGSAPLVAGRATYRVARTLAVGAHTVTATYAGGGTWAASTSAAVRVTVTKATSKTSLKVADRSLAHGQRPRLTVTVRASGLTPTGTVKVHNGGKVVGSARLSAGKATITLAALTKGTHTLRVTYAGSRTVAASSSAGVKVTSR